MRMAQAAKALIERTVLDNPFIPHVPTMPQAIFLGLPHREAFYGGAARGGKSDALLMAALQFVEVPKYAALSIMRTFTDLSLPDCPIPRSHEWLEGTGARWADRQKEWTFPSGATLTFAYMEHANDIYRYKGASFHYICWDELTQFTEAQYRYLFSRQGRLAPSRLPVRMRSASNPDGPGFDWVRQRFIVEQSMRTRPFVPARLDDNPHIDQEEYRRSLNMLDPVTRARLLNGDWDVRPSGGVFRREWFEIVESAPADARAVRFWDLAATAPKPGKDPDYTVGVRMACKDGVFYVGPVVRVRATPQGVERIVRQTAEADGRGVAIHMEQEPGSSGVAVIDHYARNVLLGYEFHGERATGDKLARAMPFSSACENGNVRLVRGPWINDFLDEAEAFTGDGRGHDDQVDAASGAHTALANDSDWLIG